MVLICGIVIILISKQEAKVQKWMFLLLVRTWRVYLSPDFDGLLHSLMALAEFSYMFENFGIYSVALFTYLEIKHQLRSYIQNGHIVCIYINLFPKMSVKWPLVCSWFVPLLSVNIFPWGWIINKKTKYGWSTKWCLIAICIFCILRCPSGGLELWCLTPLSTILHVPLEWSGVLSMYD